MSRLISDVSKRTIIVKGYVEVERIVNINKPDYIVEVKPHGEDIFEIILISRVGDYMPKRSNW